MEEEFLRDEEAGELDFSYDDETHHDYYYDDNNNGDQGDAEPLNIDHNSQDGGAAEPSSSMSNSEEPLNVFYR